ncbi:MAG: hypothetical protein ACLQU2_22325 [Candidatus Binataceae bacterium]
MTKEDFTDTEAHNERAYTDYSTLIQLASHFLPESEFNLESLTLFEAKNDLQALSTYLNSVRWKLEIAAYHVSEALASIPRVLPKDEPDSQAAAFRLHWAMMSGHDEGHAMGIAQRETEAHAIAAAQAIHSVPDLLAQALYLAFRLDTMKPMRESGRTVNRVVRALKEASIISVSWGVEQLLSSEMFKYLRAFVNTTKHRSLINYRFQWSVVNSDDFGLAISGFRYEDREGTVQVWPSKTVKEFLEDSWSFMEAAVDAIIKTSESQLASFAGSPADCFWFQAPVRH